MKSITRRNAERAVGNAGNCAVQSATFLRPRKLFKFLKSHCRKFLEFLKILEFFNSSGIERASNFPRLKKLFRNSSSGNFPELSKISRILKISSNSRKFLHFSYLRISNVPRIFRDSKKLFRNSRSGNFPELSKFENSRILENSLIFQLFGYRTFLEFSETQKIISKLEFREFSRTLEI